MLLAGAKSAGKKNYIVTWKEFSKNNNNNNNNDSKIVFTNKRDTKAVRDREKNKTKKTGSSWLLYRPFESPNSAADSKRNLVFVFLFCFFVLWWWWW